MTTSQVEYKQWKTSNDYRYRAQLDAAIINCRQLFKAVFKAKRQVIKKFIFNLFFIGIKQRLISEIIQHFKRYV